MAASAKHIYIVIVGAGHASPAPLLYVISPNMFVSRWWEVWESGCEDGESLPLELSDHRLQRDGVPGNHVICQESETSGLLVKVDRPGQEPLVAYWGGVFPARDNTGTPVDKQAPFLNGRTELVQRLPADACVRVVNVRTSFPFAANSAEHLRRAQLFPKSSGRTAWTLQRLLQTDGSQSEGRYVL